MTEEAGDHSTHQHPRMLLNDLLQHSVRFSLMAALAAGEQIDFKTLRDSLQVSDSVLSKQITLLENAGYVTVHKGFVGKRPRTSLSLSKEGRTIWTAHLSALQQIAAGGS